MNLQESIRRILREDKDHTNLLKGIIDSSDIFDYKHFCGFDIITPEERSDQYNFLNKNKIPYLIKVYFVGGPNSEVWPRTQAIRNKELDLMEELHEYIKSFVPFNIEMMGSHVNSCEGYDKLMKRKYSTDDLQESSKRMMEKKNNMKIKSIKVIKGKNKWSESKTKLIHMVLDLGEFEQKPSNKIDGFYERIKKYLPSLKSHKCSLGRSGGFFQRVKEGTWMGHIIEHVALELQTLAGYDTGWGRTRGVKGQKGVYNVIFNYENEECGKLAAKEAFNVVNDIINDKDPQIGKIVKKLESKTLIESIRRILREEDYSPAGKEITPNKIVVHKSNPMFRDKILQDGLKVRAGECYKIYVGYGVKCKPAIFATNSTNKRAWFDSTYDDDIWEINTEMIPDVKWFKDRHFESRSKHIVTFQDIPKEAITLKYKGTGSGDVKKWDKDSPNIVIESIKKILKEETNKNDIKSILFNILNQSEYVQKFDYVWSPNLSVGSPIMFINDLSESDFFDKKTNIFDLISKYWPYGKKDYEDWKDLYYGLVYGYVIKDKNSDTKILVQVIRFDDGFKIYLNPNYKKEIEGDKIFIDNEMINVFTSDENTYSNNDFTFLGIELKDKVKTINDMKNIFNYLDALI